MYGGVQPAGCITASGEVWFPSTAGVVRLGMDSEGATPAPTAIIYQVAADGRDVGVEGAVEDPGGVLGADHVATEPEQLLGDPREHQPVCCCCCCAWLCQPP